MRKEGKGPFYPLAVDVEINIFIRLKLFLKIKPNFSDEFVEIFSGIFFQGTIFREHFFRDFFLAYLLALFSTVYKILAQSEKSRKVDAITSILRKIRNSIKFEPIWVKFQN